jgi:DNA-binding transcriptional MocR family regulator
VRQGAPRLAYLIPDFHNPTGALMPAAERERLAAVMVRTRTPLVVDETQVDLSLDVDETQLPPPVAAFDRAATVLTVGSASKSFWGGLRVGWIRAAEPVVDRLVTVRATLDLGTPVLEQLAVAHLLAHRDELLAHRRDEVRRRRAALAAALREHLPSWRFELPAGGFALWCELDAPVSTALAATAGGNGVRLAPGPRFGVDGAFERFVRLPYTLPEDQLRESVARIAAVHDRLAVAPTAPPLVLTA